VRLLLEAGANPNIQLKLRPPYRNVPFDRGADPLLTTGATPLLRAAQATDVAAIRLLLEHGALVDLPNTAGVTPLMAAAGVGYGNRPSRGLFRTEEDAVASLELLLAAGADIDARADNGRTALHGAALMGWNRIVQALADQGATLDLEDAQGRTALDLARGDYRAAFLDSPPEPIEETVALLEALIAAR
jgi:ankyrin repeat protein